MRRDDCWYRLVQDALEDVAQPVESAFLTNDLEPVDGTILRLESAQQDPPQAEVAAQRQGKAPPLPDWVHEPAPPEPHPSRPLAPSRAETEPAVRSPVGAADDLSRFKRGTIIHYLMQWLPELQSELRGEAARVYLARPALELPVETQDQLAAEALAVLEDPEFSRLFSSASLAEVPISGVVRKKDSRVQVVSGQVDRLLITDGRITVVDYKTNRPPPETPDAVHPVYLRQMAAYRALLADAYPGFVIECCLLWTDGPRLMALPAALLDEYENTTSTPV